MASPLEQAAAMRFPDVTSETAPREKISKLEDYLIATSTIESDVAELRLMAQRQLKIDTDLWDSLTGWEVHLRKGGVPTPADRDRAKGMMQPNLATQMREARWLIARCGEAIEHIDRETKRVSRCYTLITGS